MRVDNIALADLETAHKVIAALAAQDASAFLQELRARVTRVLERIRETCSEAATLFQNAEQKLQELNVRFHNLQDKCHDILLREQVGSTNARRAENVLSRFGTFLDVSGKIQQDLIPVSTDTLVRTVAPLAEAERILLDSQTIDQASLRVRMDQAADAILSGLGLLRSPFGELAKGLAALKKLVAAVNTRMDLGESLQRVEQLLLCLHTVSFLESTVLDRARTFLEERRHFAAGMDLRVGNLERFVSRQEGDLAA